MSLKISNVQYIIVTKIRNGYYSYYKIMFVYAASVKLYRTVLRNDAFID